MSETTLSEYLEFAKVLAAEAGKIMLQYFRASDLTTKWKQDDSPVTIADATINRLVIDKVKAAYPEHGIIGEEESFEPDRKIVWVVDPIDGTAPFDLGMPCSTFCLSLVADGEVQVALILDPILKRCLTALKGGGTFLNDKKITITPTKDFQHTYIFAPAGNKEHPELYVPLRHDLRKLGAKTIVIPSFSYMALYILEGKMLAAFMAYGSPWDAAAISLIVQEAGGRATDLTDQERRYNEWGNGILVTNGAVHKQMVEMIAKCES